MIRKEPEPTRFLEVPYISPKISSAQLKIWSKDRWQSESRKRVAENIIQNGKELLAVSSIDWELVLKSIRTVKVDGACYGKDAIAVNDARFIGGLVARAGWSMHDPGSVYLSGIYLAHIADSKLEGFKTTMIQTAVSYGQKTLPEGELLMKTLDLLLERQGRRDHRELVPKIAVLLHDGKIQDAYTMVSSRVDFVSRRGPFFSKTTTSSILTPPAGIPSFAEASAGR